MTGALVTVDLVKLLRLFLDHDIIFYTFKIVCSGNTTITNRRQPIGTARKSHSSKVLITSENMMENGAYAPLSIIFSNIYDISKASEGVIME